MLFEEFRNRRHHHSSSAFYATIPQKDEKLESSSPTTKTAATTPSSSSNKIALGKPIPYSELTIGVLQETFPGENRVSQTPDAVASLVKAGFRVVVQAGGALFLTVAGVASWIALAVMCGLAIMNCVEATGYCMLDYEYSLTLTLITSPHTPHIINPIDLSIRRSLWISFF